MLCFRKFPVAKNLWIRGGGGGGTQFSVENFLSHSAENFVEEPVCVSENLWYRKMLGIREGRVSRFCVIIVLSHSSENFRRGIL